MPTETSQETASPEVAKVASPKPKKVIVLISQLLAQIANCQKTGNREWELRAKRSLREIERNYLPSGSGIDSGTTIDLDSLAANKIVFNTNYHHMNEGGYYDGWTSHKITVTPTFGSFDIKISGKNRNDIKEYLHDVFFNELDAEIIF